MEVAEYSLWKKFKTDKSIFYKNELIAKYMNFVRVIAHEIYKTIPKTIDFSDLESYGFIGLMDAIEKFDFKRNIKFETYARIRIKGAILDGMREIDWLPRSLRDSMKKNNSLKNDYIEDKLLGENVETQQKYFKSDVSEALNYAIFPLEYIDSCVGETSSYDEPVSTYQYNSYINPNDFVENLENASFISKAIGKLKKFEKEIIYHYYFKGKTLKEIGQLLGITESRVSQIHKAALESLRKIIK